ncbi:hypothetical protein HK102_007100 [Quaeritorhiza haematococci]|nr:hypothetical protein HK102_007100 [Quaeritorhiza haematococci]
MKIRRQTRKQTAQQKAPPLPNLPTQTTTKKKTGKKPRAEQQSEGEAKAGGAMLKGVLGSAAVSPVNYMPLDPAGETAGAAAGSSSSSLPETIPASSPSDSSEPVLERPTTIKYFIPTSTPPSDTTATDTHSSSITIDNDSEEAGIITGKTTTKTSTTIKSIASSSTGILRKFTGLGGGDAKGKGKGKGSGPYVQLEDEEEGGSGVGSSIKASLQGQPAFEVVEFPDERVGSSIRQALQSQPAFEVVEFSAESSSEGGSSGASGSGGNGSSIRQALQSQPAFEVVDFSSSGMVSGGDASGQAKTQPAFQLIDLSSDTTHQAPTSVPSSSSSSSTSSTNIAIPGTTLPDVSSIPSTEHVRIETVSEETNQTVVYHYNPGGVGSVGEGEGGRFARYLCQQIVNDLPDRFLGGGESSDEEEEGDDERDWMGEFDAKEVDFDVREAFDADNPFPNKRSSLGIDFDDGHGTDEEEEYPGTDSSKEPSIFEEEGQPKETSAQVFTTDPYNLNDMAHNLPTLTSASTSVSSFSSDGANTPSTSSASSATGYASSPQTPSAMTTAADPAIVTVVGEVKTEAAGTQGQQQVATGWADFSQFDQQRNNQGQ